MTDDRPIATLLVGTSSSRCSHCGRGCAPWELTHDTVLVYGPDNGSAGCGAVYVQMESTYPDAESRAACQRMRPDLPMTEWPA